MSVTNMLRGRQVIASLTNQSGGAIIAGDVVIVSAANDESFTTTTSAAYNSTRVGVALESIAAAAAGRILLEGYAPLVDHNGSATRGHYLFTHTVAKQATSQAGYAIGAFGQILKAGTTPSAFIFPVAQVGSAGVARSGSTTDNHLAVWNGSNADSIKDGGVVPTGSADGWTAATGTWTYSSADAPSYVISVNSDMTTTIGVGQRIKLTDTTVKYYIVTAVGAFSGGNTLITVYGGTDYTLSGGAITSPYYSVVKAPFGFPVDPAKWTVLVTDGTQRTQATPTQNQWYNLNTNAITIPIGAWVVSYACCVEAADNSTGAYLYVQTALSTANNSASDVDLVCQTGVGHAEDYHDASFFTAKYLTLASKTVYYFNIRTTQTSIDSIAEQNAIKTLMLNATCAYL